MAISGKRTPDTRNGGKSSHETGCGFLSEKCWDGGWDERGNKSILNEFIIKREGICKSDHPICLIVIEIGWYLRQTDGRA